MINERPGVYTSYELAGSLYAGGSGAAVGLAAAAEKNTDGLVRTLAGLSQAQELFGGNIAALAELLFKNGAPKLYAVAVSDGDYEAAFTALMAMSDVRFMVCDSADPQVHSQMKEIILGGDEQGKYRMGIVESALSDRAELVAAAAQLNCERMVLVSHHQAQGPVGAVAAAVCGAAASGEDPALPLNGAELLGLGDIGANFSDEDLSLLITGGITTIESVFGSRSIVRGVTTRTLTGGAADPTWREMNTVMIIDHMLPAMRDSLRRRFARVKNTAQTRGAIRTHVLVELEEYVRREIIESYGPISVGQSEADPTVCQVEFAFTVVHGLNRIRLHAHITV